MSAVRDFLRDTFRQADHILLLLCVAVNLLGIALIYSATRYDVTLHACTIKQIAAMVLGIVLYLLLSQLDLEMVLEKWPWLLGGSILFILLLAIPGVGHEVGNNRSWIAFPLFSVQPAEIVKLTFTLLLARLVTHFQHRTGLDHPGALGILCLYTGFFMALIFLVSRDAGTALVYGFIFVTMLWAGGLKLYWFILGLAAVVIGGAGLWMYLPEENYWKMRILVCLNHDLDPAFRGFQQTRSLLAIQSGKLEGMGYLHGNLTQAAYRSALPARHTDFIFSVCCEELGLIGGVVLMLLLTAILIRCVQIGLKAETPFSALLCVGYAGMFFSQIVLNVGMCLFVLPVIGLTLPFVSYGGSSLITFYAAMGVLSGVSRQKTPRWIRDQVEREWQPE